MLATMAKNSFVLVSLQEDKAVKLGKIVSNVSCRKILDFLTEKSATETEISSNLGIPMPTVHYNISHLLDAGLVSADEFHYSSKGKEVNHYKLANKYIIIAPKSTFGIRERLRSILPAALIVGASALAVKLISGMNAAGQIPAAPEGMLMAASDASEKAVAFGAEPAFGTACSALPASSGTGTMMLWLAIGAGATLCLAVLIDYIRGKFRK